MTSFFPSRTSTSATLPSYGTSSTLPVSATVGDVATVQDTASIWIYGATGWVMVASRINFAGVGTGVLNGGTITIDPGGTSYSVSTGWGIYMDYSVAPHSFFITRWSGLTNRPVDLTRPSTFISINKDGTVFESGTEPTCADDRDYIFLGGYFQSGGTILAVKSAPVLAIAPANQINDILRAIGIFKVSGLSFSGLATTLSLVRTQGVLFDRSNNWKNNEKDPHQITIAAASPVTIKRVTQTTVNFANFTTLDVGNYDAAGTVTAISGSSNQAQNMRVYQWGTGVVYVQYGQVVYPTLAQAVSALPTESFVTNPVIRPQDAVLVCSISVTKGATNLANPTQAIFHLAGKFGDVGGGASGGTASVTLQQAFDNSLEPEIQTTAANASLSLRRGATAGAGDVLSIENQAGTKVAGVTDTGVLTIGTSTGVLHSNASGVITSTDILNADISPVAAIDGTKISPNFGSQTVTTTGTMNALSVTGTSALVSQGTTSSSFGYTCGPTFGLDTSAAGTLSLGGVTATTVNVGTTTLNNTVNVATGSGISNIAIGNGLPDTLTLNASTSLTDPLLTLNKGGLAASGVGAGFEIEENGSSTGYVKVGASRTSYQLKPPAAGILELVSAGADTTLTATSTAARAFTLPDTSGALITSGDTGTVTSTMLAADSVTSAKILDGTIVNADINAVAAIDGSKVVAASGTVAGVVTTGTQTLAGDKTLSGVTTVSNTTASTSPTTGGLVVTGGVGVGGQMYINGPEILLGQGRGADGYIAYGMRTQAGTGGNDAYLTRGPGVNGSLQLANATGTGAIEIINANTGSVTIIRNGVGHVFIDGAGTAIRGRTVGVGPGFVGEYIQALNVGSTAVTNAAFVVLNGCSINLTAGIWMVCGHVRVSSVTTFTEQGAWMVSNTSDDNALRMVRGKMYMSQNQPDEMFFIGPVTVFPTTTTTYNLYLRHESGGARDYAAGWSGIYATRIA